MQVVGDEAPSVTKVASCTMLFFSLIPFTVWAESMRMHIPFVTDGEVPGGSQEWTLPVGGVDNILWQPHSSRPRLGVLARRSTGRGSLVFILLAYVKICSPPTQLAALQSPVVRAKRPGKGTGPSIVKSTSTVSTIIRQSTPG